MIIIPHLNHKLITRRLIAVMIPKRSFDRIDLKLPAEHCLLLLFCLQASEIHLAKLLPIVSLLRVELAVLSFVVEEDLFVLEFLGAAFLLLVHDCMMGNYSLYAVFGDRSAGMSYFLRGICLFVFLEGVL